MVAVETVASLERSNVSMLEKRNFPEAAVSPLGVVFSLIRR
jgi:hypothetical protein